MVHQMTTKVDQPPGALGRPLSPEQELLLCCCRLNLEELHRERIASLLARSLCWEDVSGQAARHRVMPLLYHHLEVLVRGICPTHVLNRWRRAAAESAFLNHLLGVMLHDIQEDFRRDGIPVVAFKGPVWAQMLYGNLALRPTTDLDLLVPETHAQRAIALLRGSGYTPAFSLSKEWERILIRRYSECCFVHSRSSLIVDLHWRLMPPGLSCSHVFDRLWENLQMVPLDRTRVATLGTSDWFMYCCFHGAKHLWWSLLWLCDLAELIRQRTDIDWPHMQAHATANGCRRMFDLAIHLANYILDAPVPTAILAQAKNPGRCQSMAQRAIDRLLRGPMPAKTPSRTLANLFDQSRLLDRRCDQLWHFYNGVVAPGLPEWQLLRLPVALAPVYGALRPARLLAKHLRLRVRPSGSPSREQRTI